MANSIHYGMSYSDSSLSPSVIPRGAYDSVLFDLDGVLIDSEPLHFQAWREVLRPFGICLEWDLYQEKAIGMADRPMLEMLAALYDMAPDVDRLWTQYPAKRRRFQELAAQKPPVPAGVLELLKSLRAYALAVVTSSGRLDVEPVIQMCGFQPYFQAFIFCDDVSRPKPDPEPYLKAAALLGARTPLVVEDSDAGIEAGNAAGFDTLRIDNPARMPELVRNRLMRGG